LPVFFSLEIASLEGDVKFFIRTQKKFVQLIQNNFYSQYPNIEITEAEDYVTKIYYDHRSPKDGVGMCGKTTASQNRMPSKNSGV
jgi:hypothetical protein